MLSAPTFARVMVGPVSDRPTTVTWLPRDLLVDHHPSPGTAVRLDREAGRRVVDASGAADLTASADPVGGRVLVAGDAMMAGSSAEEVAAGGREATRRLMSS